MPRGGARPGAGRPPGSPNKRTAELFARLKEDDADPIRVLVEFMQPGHEISVRLDAAKALLPYIYPRLSAQQIDLSAESLPNVTLEIVTPEATPFDAGDS